MRGNQVIVRAFGNRVLVRRVWDADEGAIYITNDEGLEKLENGDPGAAWPIGFPMEDVFRYDPGWVAKPENSKGGKPDWGQLTEYQEKKE